MKLTETILLARELMERHKLNDWKLKFDESKSHIGLCRYSEKTIYLSYPYVEINDEKIIRNTILHEISHAQERDAQVGRISREVSGLDVVIIAGTSSRVTDEHLKRGLVVSVATIIMEDDTLKSIN